MAILVLIVIVFVVIVINYQQAKKYSRPENLLPIPPESIYKPTEYINPAHSAPPQFVTPQKSRHAVTHAPQKINKSIHPSLYITKPLFTKNEAFFFRFLQDIVHDKFIIHSKVRLWDIIDANKELDRKSVYLLQNKIKQKHIDFVLIEPARLCVVLAIELDDSTHYAKKTIQSDETKNDALESAGLPLIRVKTARNYDHMYFQNLIETLARNHSY